MEAIVLTALVGAGFVFMKPAEKARPSPAAMAHAPVVAARDGPDGPPSLTYTEARDEELRRAQRLERAAAYPSITGVVDQRARMTSTERGAAPEGTVRSLLSGAEMDEEDFRHNNMVPFFGSQLPGPDLQRDHGRIVETYNGAPGVGNMRDRTERSPLFTPEERGLDNIYGNRVVTGALQARTPVAAVRNNDLPFQQVRVGPGVGQGYGTAGAGGFHQAQDRDYVMPKTVDQLRPGNSPKAEFDTSSHVLPGFDSTGGARPLQGLVQKQRPETAFESDRGSVPTGAPVRAQPARARYEPRGDVLYHDSAERGFNPGLSPVSALAPTGASEGDFRRRLSGGAAPLLNASLSDRGPGCSDGLLGREGFFPGGADEASGGLRETGRSLRNVGGSWGGGPGAGGGPTGDRAEGHLAGSAGAAVPRGTLPFTDGARVTQREYTEMSTSTGPAVPVGPPRLPLSQPRHATRTTLREATGSAPGFARGSAAPLGGGLGAACGPGDPGGDATRTTLREGADCERAYENSLRNVRNAVYGGDSSGGVVGAEAFTPDPTTRDLTALNLRDAVPTGASVVRGAGGGGAYAALVDGCGAPPPGEPGPFAGGPDGGAPGDGLLRAQPTHRQFTGQAAGAGGLGLRPARPEPTGYAVAHHQAGRTSTAAGLRGEAEVGYFGAPQNDHSRPADYGQIYAATVNDAKETLTRSRARGGHAGAARGPEIATSGQVTASDALPDSGRAAPGYSAADGNPVSRPSVALRHEPRSADRLADAGALLSWTATNPLVTNRAAF